ncbi:hypothetical protein [Methanolobus vulcani]|uniref:Uncharacterized protein n=1 Tax=Methanolobus vulcani TaxID=38026 RepID=A0A7Z8KMJ0_9EURY|nr:hypothetical protein [Methanolobus vulcani]TQD23563.1 hypothetical protein FKV42_13665 [Methanolobus vulcani]
MKSVTEAQWEVLEYFIIKESNQIEDYLKRKEWDNNLKKTPFKTYPAKIEEEIKKITGNEVSRVTAQKACQSFLEMHILEVLDKETGKHLKGRDVEPYVLKSDLRSIRKIVALIFDRTFNQSNKKYQFSYLDAMKLLNNYYFTYNINESLVKEVLAEKNIAIKRSFQILDWDLKSAQRLLEIYKVNDEGVTISEIDKNAATNIMLQVVDESEKKNKDAENSMIRRLAGYCNDFLEFVSEHKSTELSNYETRAMRLFEDFRSGGLLVPNEFQYHNEWPLSWGILTIPLCSNETTIIERITKVKKANYQDFYYVYHAEGIIKLSLIVDLVIAKYDATIWSLQEIETFLELDHGSGLSLHFENECDQFKTKWKKIVEDNDNEFDSNLSGKLLDDIKILNDGLKADLNKLTETYDADNSDLWSKIRKIESDLQFMPKDAKKHSTIEDITNDYIKNNYKTILDEHETKFEYEKVILPILALIHASPMALNEFLNGNWESSEMEFDPSFGVEQLNKSTLLSKLIQIASINLLMYPKTLTKGIIESAGMEHFNLPNNSHSQSEYYSKMDVNEYWKIYDQMHKDWYNNLTYSEIKSYEPTFLKLKLKQLYEIQYKLSFSTDSSSNADAPIYSKIDIRNHPDFDLHFLKVGDIRDSVGIIEKLRSEERSFVYIMNKFSTRMQNKLKFIDTSTQPSLSFIKEITQELNNVLLQPDFYSKDIFGYILDDKEDIKSEFEKRISNKYPSKEVMKLINIDMRYHINTFSSNKYIFLKLMKDEFHPWVLEDDVEQFEELLQRCAMYDEKQIKSQN